MMDRQRCHSFQRHLPVQCWEDKQYYEQILSIVLCDVCSLDDIDVIDKMSEFETFAKLVVLFFAVLFVIQYVHNSTYVNVVMCYIGVCIDAIE